MASQETKRLKVSTLLDADLKHKDIASIVGVSVAAVKHVAKAKREGKDIKRKEGSGRHCSVSNDDFIDELEPH